MSYVALVSYATWMSFSEFLTLADGLRMHHNADTTVPAGWRLNRALRASD